MKASPNWGFLVGMPITENRAIVVSDGEEWKLTGKSPKSVSEWLGLIRIDIRDASLYDFSGCGLVILHFNEDVSTVETRRRFAELGRALTCAVLNAPACDIGSKSATLRRLGEIAGELPTWMAVPGWALVSGPEDFEPGRPVTLTADRGSDAPHRLCESQEEFRAAYNELKDGGCVDVIGREFIEPTEGAYLSPRVFTCAGKEIEHVVRTSGLGGSFIAKSKSEQEDVARHNAAFDEWVAGREGEIARLVDCAFGPGWYATDFVWARDKLWFVETGYKLGDPDLWKMTRTHGVKPGYDEAGFYAKARSALSHLL